MFVIFVAIIIYTNIIFNFINNIIIVKFLLKVTQWIDKIIKICFLNFQTLF